MKFTEIIQKVSKDKRLTPDLMKSEKGNNFRAVSEATILDAIGPVLEAEGVFYTISVLRDNLEIKEAYGPKGKKLQFIATVCLSVIFRTDAEVLFQTESVGMGIDDGDKAMGKAYTYALKYALLKIFRLRYGDDPDVRPSEPLMVSEKQKPEAKPAKREMRGGKPSSYKSEKTDEKPMSEAQRDYILGMMEEKGITSEMIMDQFDGMDPKEDDFIPMKTARAMIKWLSEQDDLPF